MCSTGSLRGWPGKVQRLSASLSTQLTYAAGRIALAGNEGGGRGYGMSKWLAWCFLGAPLWRATDWEEIIVSGSYTGGLTLRKVFYG